MDSYKKLINEVKKNPIIYDKYHEGYNDEANKRIVWNEIGAATEMSGERAKKKWENIYNAYLSSKNTTGGNAGKFTNLLCFLETEGDKSFSTFNESSTSQIECQKEMDFINETSTPKTKKRKRDVELDKSQTEEAELSQIDVSTSPLENNSPFSVAGQDDIDCFCKMVAVRMKMLPENHVKKIKRHLLEILHQSEIESL